MPETIRIRTAALVLALLPALPAAAGVLPAPPPDPVARALAPALVGEFALQAGQLDRAGAAYLQAAEASPGDAGLAERATRIALLANDQPAAAKALALWRQRAPQSLALRAAQATLELRRGDPRAARRQLLTLLRSPDPQGWRLALVALANGGDARSSVRALASLVEAGAIPNQIEAWQEFGLLALRLDQPALAKRIVDQVARRFPDAPQVALLRASQLFQSGQRAQALALLAEVEPRVGTDAGLRDALAQAYDAMDDAGAAARVLALGPQDTRSYALRAAMLAKADDRPALQALYGELARAGREPDPGRRLLLGKIAEYLERYAEAVDWYHGVPTGPQRSEARLRAANALFELDRHAQAFDEVRALEADALAEDDARRDAYLLEAELRQKAGDDAGELDVFARALAAFPDDGALLYARALAWERRDRIDRAEADLRQVLVAEPDNVAALNALGYTLADRTDRYQEALELIDRARTAEPDNPAIIDSYGWVLYRLGRSREALVQLKRAWSLARDPEIGAHVGLVLWQLGEHAQARRYFEQARQLDPDNRSLQRALRQIGQESDAP